MKPIREDSPPIPRPATRREHPRADRGFAGRACRQASRFVEQALGRATAERLTAEFYQPHTPRASSASPNPRDRPRAVSRPDGGGPAAATFAVHTRHPCHPRTPMSRSFIMTLTERLAELVRAAFPGLWVTTHEPDDAVAEAARLCRDQRLDLATWDLERGLRRRRPGPTTPTTDPTPCPAAPTRSPPCGPSGRLATSDGTGPLVLRNYHRFLAPPEVVQALDAALARGKQDRTLLVVLPPLVQLPPELERQFVVIDHELPGREPARSRSPASVATEPGELPDGEALDAVLDAAAGLTRQEAEGAFALSLVRHGRLGPEAALGAEGPAR